jgi:hypothetical protein
VLRDERYAGHEAVPGLMRTDVPGYDDAVKRLWFDRTLGRVSYLITGTAERLLGIGRGCLRAIDEPRGALGGHAGRVNVVLSCVSPTSRPSHPERPRHSLCAAASPGVDGGPE